MKWGTCWKIIRGGGCVVGRVNKAGDLTGHRIAYLYPDFKTALVGSFVEGVMECAQEAELKTVIDDNGIKVPIFTEPNGKNNVFLLVPTKYYLKYYDVLSYLRKWSH